MLLTHSEHLKCAFAMNLLSASRMSVASSSSSPASSSSAGRDRGESIKQKKVNKRSLLGLGMINGILSMSEKILKICKKKHCKNIYSYEKNNRNKRF